MAAILIVFTALGVVLVDAKMKPVGADAFRKLLRLGDAKGYWFRFSFFGTARKVKTMR